MTLIELTKALQKNDFVINGKHYYTKPEIVENGCEGCYFINSSRCSKIGITNICCNYPVIFDKLSSTKNK